MTLEDLRQRVWEANLALPRLVLSCGQAAMRASVIQKLIL